MEAIQRQEIGTRLRDCREKLHLTQAQMADKLEMSTNYYGQIERGQKGLSIKKAILCCIKLEIDLNFLLAGISPLENQYNDYLKKCPIEKQIYVEQLMKIIYELCK